MYITIVTYQVHFKDLLELFWIRNITGVPFWTMTLPVENYKSISDVVKIGRKYQQFILRDNV